MAARKPSKPTTEKPGAQGWQSDVSQALDLAMLQAKQDPNPPDEETSQSVTERIDLAYAQAMLAQQAAARKKKKKT